MPFLGRHKFILTDFSLVDKTINRLKPTLVADKVPLPQIAYQEFLMASQASGEYFS
jgi:hypothetical protein